MLAFQLIESPTPSGLVDRLNQACVERPGLKPHGPAFYDTGRWRQFMMLEVETGAPADRPYVTAYSDGMGEALGTQVSRLLAQGYVLWGPLQGNSDSTWQVMVARSAIGGGV